jgi:ribosome-associated protein
MDFGDVIVHVFRQDARQYYGLERLWADAKRVAIPGYELPPPLLTSKSVTRTRARAAKRA